MTRIRAVLFDVGGPLATEIETSARTDVAGLRAAILAPLG
jgi:hypothetical protein